MNLLRKHLITFVISAGNADELGSEMDRSSGGKKRALKSKDTTRNNYVRQIWKINKNRYSK